MYAEMLIYDQEISEQIEDHYSNYIFPKDFYLEFSEKDREIAIGKKFLRFPCVQSNCCIDGLVLDKNYLYKSANCIKMENTKFKEITDAAMAKYLKTIQPEEPFRPSMLLEESKGAALMAHYEAKEALPPELEKPLAPPFNSEYYCPITGDH